MNQRSLDKLEFFKVKEEIKKRAVSGAGKERIDGLMPLASPAEVRRALREVAEAMELLRLKGAAPFEGVFDVRDEIHRAGKGATLTPGALLRIANLMRSARLFVKYLHLDEKEMVALNNLTSAILPLKNLEHEIETAIASEEEVSDRASAKLANIRRSLKEKSSSVKDKIQSLVRSQSAHLQENLYTIRGDRYVLPVKASDKGSVPGLVHDQSASGQTLYIEPMSLVNLNNEIKELMLAEKAEIERILRALSALVQKDASQVLRNAQIVYELDSIFARARYGEIIDAYEPEITEDQSFHFYSARHPLISPKKVVPSTIYLGGDHTSLVITGPNTGGKTVTLKTVGLLHAMALSGIPIPVNEHSKAAFFHEIYADIGDEQSIEQSLSTFSSHMTNIVSIMEKATEEDLVLFDELGAGTDPTEGAALAIAILEELRHRQTKVIATTHYSELKAYALRTEGVENASVEFDVKTLRPTYRLLIGIPGKSNAFLISQRLGLSQEIIDSSRKLISEDSLRFEDLIENLQEKSRSATLDAKKSQVLLEEAKAKEAKVSEELKRIEKQKDHALEEARREARSLLRSVKEEADDILKSLRQLVENNDTGSLRKELEKNRQRLRDTLDRLETEDPGEDDKEIDASLAQKVKEGMELYHRGISTKVTVLSKPDAKGDLMVQAGIMKVKANLKDLEVNKEMKKEAKQRRKVNLNLRQVPSSLDLRGQDGEEAAYQTDHYLDEAAMGGLGEVTIIHGVGTGVLKKRITQLLKNHPHVKSSRPGKYGEGGVGVTIVEVQ